MEKFSNGTKVSIKAGTGFPEPYSDIWQYENLTGAIVSSKEVMRYQIPSWGRNLNSPHEVVQVYKVHLDIGIEAANMVEECLEACKPLAWSAKPRK